MERVWERTWDTLPHTKFCENS